MDRWMLWHLRESGDTAGVADTLADPQVVVRGRVSQFGQESCDSRSSLLVPLAENACADEDALPLILDVLRRCGEDASIRASMLSSRLSHVTAPRVKRLLKSFRTESRQAPRTVGGLLWARAVCGPDSLLPSAAFQSNGTLCGADSAAVPPVCSAFHPLTGQERVCIGHEPTCQGEGMQVGIRDVSDLREIRKLALQCSPPGGKARRQVATVLFGTRYGSVIGADAEGGLQEWHASRPPNTSRVDRFLFSPHLRCIQEGDGGSVFIRLIALSIDNGDVLVAVRANGTASVHSIGEGVEEGYLGDIQLHSEHPVSAALPGGALLVGAPASCVVRAFQLGEVAKAAVSSGREIEPPRGVVIHSLPPGEGIVACCGIPAEEGRWSAACAILSGHIAVFHGRLADWTGAGPVGMPPDLVLSGHVGPTRGLVASPCGGWLFSAASDADLRAWDLRQDGRSAQCPAAEWQSPDSSPEVGDLLLLPPVEGSLNGGLRLVVPSRRGVRTFAVKLPKQAPQGQDAAARSGRLLFSDGQGNVISFTGEAGVEMYDACGATGKRRTDSFTTQGLARILEGGEPQPDAVAAWHDRVLGRSAAAAPAMDPGGDDTVNSQGPKEWGVSVEGRSVRVISPLGDSAVVEVGLAPVCACVAEHKGRAVLCIAGPSPSDPPAFFELVRFRPVGP